MMKEPDSKSGPWGLRTDLLTVHSLLWVAHVHSGGEPTPEVHLYLYDRYWRLAEYHKRRGHSKKASRLRVKAMMHYSRSGNDRPPSAAALAMPVPRPPLFTRAVARQSSGDPDDAA
jgi:hypothetical protein